MFIHEKNPRHTSRKLVALIVIYALVSIARLFS